LEPEVNDYVQFHLDVVGCPFCLANLEDLKAQERAAPAAAPRQRRFFDSSAGLLRQEGPK
jgi:hypothetical protein